MREGVPFLSLKHPLQPQTMRRGGTVNQTRVLRKMRSCVKLLLASEPTDVKNIQAQRQSIKNWSKIRLSQCPIKDFWGFFASKTLNIHLFFLPPLNLNYKFFAC